MKAITIGMILYCALCAVVLLGLSLYQEIKHNRAIEGPGDEGAAGSKAANGSAKHVAPTGQPQKNKPTTRRAA